MVISIFQEISGWGRYPKVKCKIYSPSEYSEIINLTVSPLIARGLGRSYGDSSLQPKGTIDTRKLNKILLFDQKKGIIQVQSGISVASLIEYILPKGWFMPVSAGTKYVSIGGMVASDVHGKNHHLDGSFGNFIKEIKIINKLKEIVTCSVDVKPELFWNTIGGMGLTGIIVEVSFSLLAIQTSFIKNEVIATRNLKETMMEFQSIKLSKYSVAWLDCTASGTSIGRSIIFKGEHALRNKLPNNLSRDPIKVKVKKNINIPFTFPEWILNKFTIKIFNFLYYFINKNKNSKFIDYDTFFYPLDSISNWNLIYGKKGFIQYQFVLPEDKSYEGIKQLIGIFQKYNIYPFLSVLKLMGDSSKGTLSFPMKGYSLALDFPISKNLFKMLNEFDNLVIKYSGKVYLTKDSRINKKDYKEMYKNQLRNFDILKDNKSVKFSSLQSERLDFFNL
tara:strand:+ start:27883 stop:29226 length:1344 start_codon:yes stop_codon:yes gene_type:complete